MTKHIALLRGVNVGRNPLKMDRLRALSAELGLRNVRTYLQSGNLIFEAGPPASHWSQALEAKLEDETRLAVTAILRSALEIGRILADNPFLKEPGIDPAKLHVTFLAEAPAESARQSLGTLDAGLDRFKVAATEIYLHCPGGYGRTKLSNNAFEKRLAVRATTRSWKTVSMLYELSRGERRA